MFNDYMFDKPVGSNRAYSIQLKHKGVKYAFIVVENNKGLPIGMIAYKGAIIARAGTIVLRDSKYYFKGLDANARAKCLFGKMTVNNSSIALLAALALSKGASSKEILKILSSFTDESEVIAKVLSKGIVKYQKIKV